MNPVLRSLAFAVTNLFHPAMLWLMVWPVLVAALVWGTVAAFFLGQMALWFVGVLTKALSHWELTAAFTAGDATLWGVKLLMLVLLVPLIQITAILILGAFGMDAAVAHVRKKEPTALEARRGGTLSGSLANSATALAGMVGLFVLSAPLWIFPPLWVVIPLAVLAWVNQRALRYDALARHADSAEMKEIFRRERAGLYVLGLLLAVASGIPFAGLFAPVVFALAFAHFLLGALDRMRREPGAGPAGRNFVDA